jgi:hypothetical protein
MARLTMRGAKIDMDQLVRTNGHKVALGNAGVNARGDKIGSGGVVLQTREQVMSEYNVGNPKAVRQVGLNDIRQEMLMTTQPEPTQNHRQQLAATVEAVGKADKPTKRKIAETEV